MKILKDGVYLCSSFDICIIGNGRKMLVYSQFTKCITKEVLYTVEFSEDTMCNVRLDSGHVLFYIGKL